MMKQEWLCCQPRACANNTDQLKPLTAVCAAHLDLLFFFHTECYRSMWISLVHVCRGPFALVKLKSCAVQAWGGGQQLECVGKRLSTLGHFILINRARRNEAKATAERERARERSCSQNNTATQIQCIMNCCWEFCKYVYANCYRIQYYPRLPYFAVWLLL